MSFSNIDAKRKIERFDAQYGVCKKLKRYALHDAGIESAIDLLIVTGKYEKYCLNEIIFYSTVSINLNIPNIIQAKCPSELSARYTLMIMLLKNDKCANNLNII